MKKKTMFRDGYSYTEGSLIIKGVTYEGKMPDEASVEYNESPLLTSYGESITAKLDASIERIEMRWGDKWYDNIEDVVDDGWLHPVPSPLHATLMSYAEDMDAEAPEVEELVAWMRVQTWSDFLQDLVKWYDEHEMLTPKQIAAAKKVRGSTTAKRLGVPKTAKKPTEVPAPPAPASGFYRDSAGTVFVIRLTGEMFFAFTPIEYGQAIDWQPISPKLPSDSVFMPTQQVLAFGMMNGVCLPCGMKLSDDNDDGIHDACAALIYESYKYRPPTAGVYEDE